MVSRPELGSDPPFGSGRESGRDTAHTCTFYPLFDPLVGGFIQVYPYVILILKHTFVISSLLSLYKLDHACK